MAIEQLRQAFSKPTESSTPIETLRWAIKADASVRIKYYPNKTGESLTGWRHIVPLAFVNKKATDYLLAWFTDGSSVSGNEGYRLYFVKNIKAADVKPDKFAMITIDVAPIKQKVMSVNLEHMAHMMILRGEVEGIEVYAGGPGSGPHPGSGGGSVETHKAVKDFMDNYNAEDDLGISMDEAMGDPGMCSAVSNAFIDHTGKGKIETVPLKEVAGYDDAGQPITDHTAVLMDDGDTVVDLTIGQFTGIKKPFIGPKAEWKKIIKAK